MLAEMSAKTNAKYPGGVLGGGFMIISLVLKKELRPHETNLEFTKS